MTTDVKMTKEEVWDKIVELVAERGCIEDLSRITQEASLSGKDDRENLEFDSLGLAELTMAIEDCFNISLNDEERLGNLSSLGEYYKYILELLGDRVA